MTPLEKLARDICWSEFAIRRKDVTKAAYWRGVHPDKKAKYLRDAEWLVFIVQKLKPLRILLMVDLPRSDRRARR